MDSWAANPCSRKTSPPMGKQKVYCASTAQVCVLHDAMPEHLRAADVDFIRGVVHPVQQWPNKPPKTDGSAAPIPISQDLALTAVGVGAAVAWRVSGSQRSRQRRGSLAHRACPVRKAKVDIAEAERDLAEDDKVLTLPEGFSLHDLRHYLVSLLISSGADIKTVQARMRHASARTRLDVYGHLWPDADESTRTAGCCDCRADGLVANCGRPADGLASEPAYMQVKRLRRFTRRSTARPRTGEAGSAPEGSRSPA
jgi:hypothetical protein